MAAKKKQRKRAKKPKRPGPDPEALKIPGDPLAAFDKMVKATSPKKSTGDEGK